MKNDQKTGSPSTFATRQDPRWRLVAEFCREQQINPHNAWSIGNSMKADINHALRIGMNGIHVPNPSWDYEEEEAIGDYLVADCLWDCIRFIEHTEKE